MSNSPQSAEKRLITVASGKGGVGKTWFSVTLAHTLASQGKTVMLFDGDLGLANVDIQLGLMPSKDLGTVLSGEASLKEAVTRYVDPAGVTVDVVAGKSGSGALSSLSQSMLIRLKDDIIECAHDYDHVILDLAAGLDAAVTTLSQHTGKILVVMTGDPTSLTDAYAFIKVTASRNPGADISIVVNNVATKRDGEKAFEAIKRAAEGFLKISPTLLGIIRTDSKVTEAIRSQMPLLARHPQADAADDIKALAGKL